MNTDKFDRILTWIAEDDAARVPTDRPDLVDFDDVMDSDFSNISTTSAFPGDAFSAETFVRNNGTASAGSYEVSFYASTNDIISTGDTLLGSTTISSTNPFNFSGAQISVNLPSNLAAGDYYIGWIIDSGSQVGEFLEGNNIGLATEQLTIEEIDDDHGNDSASATFTSAPFLLSLIHI